MHAASRFMTTEAVSARPDLVSDSGTVEPSTILERTPRNGEERRPSHPALVVVDYLGHCDRDGGFAAEEEDAASSVERVLRVQNAVDVTEPEETQRDDPPK
jgi:hypothetical protein